MLLQLLVMHYSSVIQLTLSQNYNYTQLKGRERFDQDLLGTILYML